METFVVQFDKDVDNTISHFFNKSGMRDDPTALGLSQSILINILFELDVIRLNLSEYTRDLLKHVGGPTIVARSGLILMSITGIYSDPLVITVVSMIRPNHIGYN